MDETHLIAEDLLLLLLDDEKGTLAAATYADTAIGGALLVELALGGHVEVGEKGRGWFATAKVHDVPRVSPPVDPVLRAAREQVAEKERSAQDLVGRLGRGVREALTSRLEQRGILRRDEGRVLGLFPRTRWPAADSRQEDAVRADLTAVLLDDAPAGPRTGALVALLSALDHAQKVVVRDGVTPRDVRRRAKDLSEEGGWAPEAVKDAIQASQAAMAAVVAASSTAAATTAAT